jgi:uncharacterized protein involved in exopolysaccharide biosynthesis
MAAYAVRLERFVLQLPAGLGPTLDRIAVILGMGAVGGAVLSAVAALWWCARRAWRHATRRRDDTVIDLRDPV